MDHFPTPYIDELTEYVLTLDGQAVTVRFASGVPEIVGTVDGVTDTSAMHGGGRRLLTVVDGSDVTWTVRMDRIVAIGQG
ncbi:hypothetical protein [Streptomyces sp. CBG33]|uniref:hypothetical protein n=1 Tax=Streptomyces sp. CBG33 TaxID=2762624 RepID=UPI0016450E21|nr:hypothetical protein [Streptomyces sp. CBG33]